MPASQQHGTGLRRHLDWAALPADLVQHTAGLLGDEDRCGVAATAEAWAGGRRRRAPAATGGRADATRPRLRFRQPAVRAAPALEPVAVLQLPPSQVLLLQRAGNEDINGGSLLIALAAGLAEQACTRAGALTQRRPLARRARLAGGRVEVSAGWRAAPAAAYPFACYGSPTVSQYALKLTPLHSCVAAHARAERAGGAACRHSRPGAGRPLRRALPAVLQRLSRLEALHITGSGADVLWGDAAAPAVLRKLRSLCLDYRQPPVGWTGDFWEDAEVLCVPPSAAAALAPATPPHQPGAARPVGRECGCAMPQSAGAAGAEVGALCRIAAAVFLLAAVVQMNAGPPATPAACTCMPALARNRRRRRPRCRACRG